MSKKHKKVINENNTKMTKSSKILIGIIISTLILTIITLMNNSGEGFFHLFFCDPDDYFMDFFNSVFFAQGGTPYSYSVIYPPVINIFYYLIGLFIPVFANGVQIRESFEGQMIFMIYMITLILSFVKVINNYNKDSKLKNLITFLLVLSVPMLYGLQRGNSVVIALIFLIIYLTYYNHEKKYLRELALISLAISFNIKIYPAIFGVLLIREKRWKDAIKCSIYALLLFFIPFIFFGGMEGLTNFFSSLKSESSHVSNLRFGWKINFTNTISYFTYIMGSYVSEIKLSIISYIILGVSVISSFFIKSKWKLYLLLGVIIAGFPQLSYPYTLIFVIPGLIEFINKKEDNKINIVYAILIAGCVSSFLFINIGPLYVLAKTSYMIYYLTTFIQGLSLLLLVILLNIDGIKNMINRKKNY